MANQEQLDILRRGAQAWNQWRKEHPDIIRPDLINANLGFANLSDANLSGAIVGYTSFGDVDLSVVKNLEKVTHRAPSTIGIDTIYRSGGNIPEVFLREAGVPDSFLEYMRSLVSNPIDYYSCFISHSSKDQAFAERLYADLKSKGVRCWLATHDMKIGDEVRLRIDETGCCSKVCGTHLDIDVTICYRE